MLVKQFLRKGFLAEAIPISLRGIGGPGAPHVFDLSLRNTLSAMVNTLSLHGGMEFKGKSFHSTCVLSG